MAGIPNQPTGKPGSVPTPVPQTSALDAYADAPPKGGSALDSYADAAPAPEAAAPAEPSFGQRAAEVAADWAPAVGGVMGGIGGAAFGPVGAVGGAAVGGALGQQYREFIETQILGKPALDQEQSALATGKAALTEGAGQAAGLGIAKAGSKIAASKFGQKAAAAIADAAEVPLNYLKTTIQGVRDKITEPVTKLIAEKGTSLTAEGSGDAVKSLLKDNIKAKYGPFVQAYGDLDAVAKTVPLDGAVRQGFTNDLRKWGTENLAGDSLRTVKKFAGSLDTAASGTQFESVLGQIADARQVALQSGATKQAAVLKQLQNKAEDFMELETTKLAARIQAGKATPQEISFLDQIVKSRGIQEPDPTKYAKSLANDYLKAKDKIKSDYAGFRSFLEDVGEQTKVKSTKRGPMRFLDEIDDVPSEKLVERMFDPKNAAALRRMQKETPEVFDQVARAKMSQIVQKSSPNGKLDLQAFRAEVHKVPDATRAILFKPDDMRIITQTVDNPRLKKLAALENVGSNSVVKLIGNIVEAGRITGGVAAKGVGKAAASPAGRQVTGKAALTMGQQFLNAFTPQGQEPPQ